MSYFKLILGIVGKRLFKSATSETLPESTSTTSTIVNGFVIVMDYVDINPVANMCSTIAPLVPSMTTTWQILKYTSPILLDLALAHPYLAITSLIVFTDFPIWSVLSLTYRGAHYMIKS